MLKESKHYSDTELLEIFPESKQIVPALIKELEYKRSELLDLIIEHNAVINRESPDESYRYFWKAVVISPLREERELVDQKLNRLRRQLRVIKGVPIPIGAITNDMIQAAKEVPIESLFSQQFKKTGNKLVGLCPFMPEKTPSFFIYKDTNRCWCFGCQQGYGVLDTYIKLNECSLNEAVLALTGGRV